jgi:hypothetical protein
VSLDPGQGDPGEAPNPVVVANVQDGTVERGRKVGTDADRYFLLRGAGGGPSDRGETHHAARPGRAAAEGTRPEAPLLPFLGADFGNPSSDHVFGEAPKAALRLARGRVAALVGSDAQEIIFAGSGSEADALAIRGTVMAATKMNGRTAHAITQVTEHPAVLAACRALQD